MSALRELLASFRIDVDVKKLEEMNKKIDEGSKKFMELGELLVGGVIAEGFREFVEHGVEAGAQLKIMSERLGLSTDELQKFQFAAAQSGASAEDADAGLRLLNRTIGEATNGNADAAGNFQRLGVALKDASGQVRPTTEIVADIADKMKGTASQAKRTKIAMDAFGRGGVALVPLLSEGREGIEKLYGAFEELGGGMDEAFVEQAHEVEKAQGRMSLALLSLKTKVLAIVLPYVERATEFFTRLMVGFKKLTDGTNFFTTAMLALGTAFAVFTIGKVWALVGGFEGLATAFSEILLPLAAFALAYLVFDDFYTLLTGGDSVIGTFIDRMYGVGASAEAVGVLKRAWNELTDAIGSANEESSLMGKTVDVLASVGESLVDIFKAAFHSLQGIGEYLLAIPKGVDEMSRVTSRMMDNLANDANNFGKDISGQHDYAGDRKDLQDFAAPLPKAPQVSSPGTFHRPAAGDAGAAAPQTNHVTLNIHGIPGDKKAIGEAARKGTMDALSDPTLRNAQGAVGTGM